MVEMTKSDLEELYTNNSNKYVCEKLGVTSVTLLKYIRLAGIKEKGKGSTIQKIKFIDEE